MTETYNYKNKIPHDSASDIGWKIGAQKGYFRCLREKLKLVLKPAQTLIIILKKILHQTAKLLGSFTPHDC